MSVFIVSDIFLGVSCLLVLSEGVYFRFILF